MTAENYIVKATVFTLNQKACLAVFILDSDV
jgi:hypothetical protein